VDPLDMTYDGDLHAGSLTIPPPPFVRHDDGSRADSALRDALPRASERGVPLPRSPRRTRPGGGRIPGNLPTCSPRLSRLAAPRAPSGVAGQEPRARPPPR